MCVAVGCSPGIEAIAPDLAFFIAAMAVFGFAIAGATNFSMAN